MAERPNREKYAYIPMSSNDACNDVRVRVLCSTTVVRNESYGQKTTLDNPKQHPVEFEMQRGSAHTAFIDAGKGERFNGAGTAVTLKDTDANSVIIWNPDRLPVNLNFDGGIGNNVTIYVREDEKQSLNHFAEEKVKVAGSMEQNGFSVVSFETPDTAENVEE